MQQDPHLPRERRLSPISPGSRRCPCLRRRGRPPWLLLIQRKSYALAELVNLAEQNNPETRVAWENAKAKAANLGVSKSTLYPTLAAAAVAQSVRTYILFFPDYIRQTLESYSPALEVDYTVFDFGRRLDEIAISRNELLAANFLFNDTHRKVIYQVMAAYYRVLNTKGQEDAAEANLKNAQTVQQAAEARLDLGLATLPDVLEARSAAAQADYDLQAAVGASEIAHGDLATCPRYFADHPIAGGEHSILDHSAGSDQHR